jgi:signal transduction histidine kinase
MGRAPASSPEIRAAFEEQERERVIVNIKVGCAIGMVLMPAGWVLDFNTYQGLLREFLIARFISSVFIGGLLGLLLTKWGHAHYRFLGITLFMVPASFIAWMIYFSGAGAVSPYYAGLNLVLLVLAFVLRWGFRETLLVGGLVLALYMLACFPAGLTEATKKVFASNLFYLGCTAIIAATGSYFNSRSRFREFAATFELARNRRELEETNQKLLEMDQVKSRFFANISHELRTPLTLLLAPLETILNQHGRKLDDQARSMLLTMHANGMRLLKLINDLLDLVRLESGRIEVRREAVVIEDFIKGIMSAARQVAEDKRLTLEASADPGVEVIVTDRDKLEKILLNLVFNALKFTPPGGRVEARVRREGSNLVLVVADTGMGISEKNLPFVFDRFWQADGSSKRKYQGTGIGLALVKELAEIQGGKVSVTSQEGSGTVFTVSLPYEEGQAPEFVPPPSGKTETVSSEEWLSNLYRRAELFPALTHVRDAMRPVESTQSGDRATVLVADDEPDMLRFLKSQLGTHYQVLEAVDGQQAVEKARQFLPDIILLDMMMPEKDGLQACVEIRGHPTTKNIPVIILTARADEETKLSALSSGASDFLSKPFSVTELHVRVKNLLETHNYQRKLAKQNRSLEYANDQLKSTIDQLKETEAQLVQSEKLNSLGVMSAGIMHEINNPLNWAMTGLYTLREKGRLLEGRDREEYQEFLNDVEDGLKRVKKIVADLRSFAHKDNVGRDQVEVVEAVEMALRFLSHEWKDKIRIEQHIAQDQAIWANRNMLVQVLLNLIQNSIQALREKEFTGGEEPTIWIEGKVERGLNLVVVRDNGPGIRPENQAKIFEPFFTTKEVGSGMGLGLSICFRMVQEFEGRILVRSEHGKFCEFTLEFPNKGEFTTEAEGATEKVTTI